MRLAIADPPYLGRARRWYGDGRGSGGGRHKADSHPRAAEWDRPETHVQLVGRLAREYDGWALFCGASGLATVLPACPAEVIVCAWTVTNAPPCGSRVHRVWEPVVVLIPSGRRGRAGGPPCRTSLTTAAARGGFAGAKPPAVTRWVLDLLGATPDDTVTDLFHGSGAVAAELATPRMPWL